MLGKVDKNQKEKIDHMFYVPVTEKEEREEKKKRRERERRIRERQEKQTDQKFDLDTETVISMTNRNNQKKQQAKKQVMDKNQRRIQKRKKRIKRMIKWTSLLLILAGGVTFALVSPIFDINDIQVVDNKQVSSETIISLSGLAKGKNIFQYMSSKVEKQIKENPYIDEVKVNRVFPNAVKITIKEREKRFSLAFLDGYAYLTSQGYILEITNDPAGYPILQGASTPEEQIIAGNRLETNDLEKLGTVIQIMDAAKSCELDTKVTSLDMSNKNEYSMIIESEKKTIYLGDGSNLSNKMLWVKSILEDNQGIEGDIFVNGDLNNKFKPRFRAKV